MIGEKTRAGIPYLTENMVRTLEQHLSNEQLEIVDDEGLQEVLHNSDRPVTIAILQLRDGNRDRGEPQLVEQACTGMLRYYSPEASIRETERQQREEAECIQEEAEERKRRRQATIKAEALRIMKSREAEREEWKQSEAEQREAGYMLEAEAALIERGELQPEEIEIGATNE